MPVERVPTPCQIPPIWERNAEMFEDARNFIEYVSTYLAKDFYKLTLYAYTVLLAFFIAIIEARHYDFKQMGDTIFILAIFVLFCMGATCSFTFFAMTCRHALFLVPLLFLQVFVLLYGITNYFCPFVLTNEAPMKADMDMESSDIAKWIFCAKMVIYSVFRVTPLLVHFLLTMITIKSVGCMMIVQKFENDHALPIHFNTLTNSHVWSSIRRKIHSRHILENISQSAHLADPTMMSEMSAKFRFTKYPRQKLQEVQCV